MKDPLIKNYISDSYNFDDEPRRHSSLAAALRDARKFSNRDMSSGVVTLEQEAPLFPNSWATALLYFIVLDQIGKCFINKLRKSKNFQGFEIYKALKHFSELSDVESYALESLRHSFAHNYGLCNVKKDKNTKEIVAKHTHIFILTAAKNGKLITLPEKGKNWNGNFTSKVDESHTHINLWLLGDFVEDVFRNLKCEYEKDNVDLILEGGLDELKTRFTFLS